MSTGVGIKIKYFRLKNNLTQEELAKDIVSVSYLSKIERNISGSSEEIINKLCERLKISTDKTVDDQVNNQVYTFKVSLNNKDLSAASDLYEILEAKIEQVIDGDLFWLLTLNTLYYFILTKQVVKASDVFKLLTDHQKDLNKEEQYYWLKFSGYYERFNGNYEVSFRAFLEAEKYVKDVFKVADDERVDLYYEIAKTATTLQYVYHASTYADRALTFYRNCYRLFKSAKCHILKGINYKYVGEMSKAESQFMIAKALGEKMDKKVILCKAYIELGALFYDRGNLEEAERYYRCAEKLSDPLSNSNNFKIALGMLNISMRKNETELSRLHFEKLKAIVDNNDKLPLTYIYHLKVLNFTLNGYNKSFETLLIKEVLPYYKKCGLVVNYAAYLKLLADYYCSHRKYKSAAQYYQEKCAVLRNCRYF